MQMITTKYVAPTDRRGARIKAVATGKESVSIPYPYHLSGLDVHWEAANALRAKLNWSGSMIGAEYESGAVFIFASERLFGESSTHGESLKRVKPSRKPALTYPK
jgi:hypothetical protein